jgi:hypothetical protein
MTEDLIIDLSKLSGLFVVARNSVFFYKNKKARIRDVAEALGVRYVFEGSVRLAGVRVRINAQLIDALSGDHVWAETYDGVLGDVFDIQDKITQRIVNALEISLTHQEQINKAEIETKVPKAYEAFLRGWERYRLGTPEDIRKSPGARSELCAGKFSAGLYLLDYFVARMEEASQSSFDRNHN